MDYASISSVRPDRPLVVKCALDRYSKTVTFTSARNCSVKLLKTKVEECFSLAAGSYTIAYKDDDGEVLDIVTDADLTEAVLYFQSGVEDVPVSSAASFYSARSSGSRRITLRVHVRVDYDGPSLSDTSSLFSTEDGRNDETEDYDFQDALSLTDSLGAQVEGMTGLEDDQVTISSKDTGLRPPIRRDYISNPSSETLTRVPGPSGTNSSSNRGGGHFKTGVHSKKTVATPKIKSSKNHARSPLSQDFSEDADADDVQPEPTEADLYETEYASAAARFPADPSAVFERLKYLELTSRGGVSGQNSATPEFKAQQQPHQASIDRGKQWLREQSSRSVLAPLMSPKSENGDNLSLSAGDGDPLDDFERTIEEDLALQRGSSGQYYYTYRAASCSAPSQSQDFSSDYQEKSVIEEDYPNGFGEPSTSSGTSNLTASVHVDDYPPVTEIPAELLPFIESVTPPEHTLTDCSSCGRILDSIRYVCGICGEKKPRKAQARGQNNVRANGKGKSRYELNHHHTYPPIHDHRMNGYYSPSSSGSAATSNSSIDKPLPGIPGVRTATKQCSVANSSCGKSDGYELCSNCMQFMGVLHAVEATEGGVSGNDGGTTPESPDALSAMRRSAPKKKGKMRHAYLEKYWAGSSWQDVEQDLGPSCSICSSSLAPGAYKCTSCDRFDLCRACYSQVHEIHPSHAFIAVGNTREANHIPPSPRRAFSDTELLMADGDSMIHPGVTCAHCLRPIIGARFHCAICVSVDICSNCESAGLPGNLTAEEEGGHDSSHIMIKIPFPVESAKIEIVSRRAIQRWTHHDAPSLENETDNHWQRRRSGSVESDQAPTLIIGRMSERRAHGFNCRACGKNIIDVRYQCATCPSLPTAFNLCSDCEPLSYIHHDPMHSFLKIIRPLDRPVESPFGLLPAIYKTPVGLKPDGAQNLDDPTEYLKSLYHPSSLCDVCMEHITGEWYRCVYCAKDLCREHEQIDTHNPDHLFIVFKSLVDMPQYRNFTDLEDAARSPPLIPYAVYHSRLH